MPAANIPRALCAGIGPMAGRTKRLVDWEKGSANTTDGCLCLPETPSFRSAVIDHHAASIATVHCVHLLGYAQILTLVSYAALFSLSIHFSPHFFICFVFPAFLSSLSRFNKYFRRFSLVFIFPYPIHPAGLRACLRPLRLPATPCAARRRHWPIKKSRGLPRLCPTDIPFPFPPGESACSWPFHIH